MTEVVARNRVLSDSGYRTRPAFSTFMKPDSNAGGTDLEQIREKQIKQHMKFPVLTGRADVDSFSEIKNPKPLNPAFIKYNPQGIYKAIDPGRINEPLYIDPVSGFLSPGGDLERNTGHTRINLFRGVENDPQRMPGPPERHTIRKTCKAAPHETRRFTESDPGSPYPWNSRQFIDVAIRAELGGWTSDKDPRKVKEEALRAGKERSKKDESKEIRLKLANRYLYTSSTQSAYEEVPWDNMLAPQLWAPTTTMEKAPDVISRRFTTRRYEPKAEEWQSVGRSWDKFQTRTREWKNGPMDIVFCAPKQRALQIPGYGADIGAENLNEMDNMKEPFHPFTVKRGITPWQSETSHRPNIPGYMGVTWYRSQSAPAVKGTELLEKPTNPHMMSSSQQSTHRVYPADDYAPEYIRHAPFTRSITNLQPYNAFNKMRHPQPSV